jgi:hypothetical protein
MVGVLAYLVALRLFFPEGLEEMVWLVTGKRQPLFELLKVRLASKPIS